MSKPIEIVIGRGLPFDPAAGDAAYNNPSLAGKDLVVSVYGSGPYPYDDYEVLDSGGFILLNGGVFGSNGQVWFVTVIQSTAFFSDPNPDYTNGFNITKVFPAFQGRLGWSQPTLAGMPAIDSDNQSATSGRYFEDFHPSCTIQKLFASQEDPAITSNNFNALLQKMDRSVIMRCMNAVFNRRQLIDHSLIYTRNSNVRNVIIPNGGNFCGYRLKIASGDFAAQINSIALFFTGVATFNFYLFNDLSLAPLQTIQVTTKANDQTVIPLNWVMNYNGTNKGGIFYIGYFQDDIAAQNVQAIDEQLNLWADSKIFGSYPFQAVKTGALNFNRNYPSVVFRTYGFNAEISSYKDWTEKIIQNAHLFDEARGLSMAISVLDLIKNSSRTNKDQRQADEQTRLDWDLNLAFPTQDRPFVAGLKAQLAREFKRLNDNFFPKAEAQSVVIAGDYDRDAFAYDSFDLKNLPPRERFY